MTENSQKHERVITPTEGKNEAVIEICEFTQNGEKGVYSNAKQVINCDRISNTGYHQYIKEWQPFNISQNQSYFMQ